jgi:hypothetical protein
MIEKERVKQKENDEIKDEGEKDVRQSTYEAKWGSE